jgi:hypothetical protein
MPAARRTLELEPEDVRRGRFSNCRSSDFVITTPRSATKSFARIRMKVNAAIKTTLAPKIFIGLLESPFLMVLKKQSFRFVMIV